MSEIPIEIGWNLQANTGWGLFAMHLALGLARQGRRVFVPPGPLTGIPATLQPSIAAMMELGDRNEYRIRFDPWGNHAPPFVDIPNRFRVLLAVFEDTEAIDVATMNRYDLVLAPSRWVQSLLTAKGVESTLWHQGYDESVFYPAPRRRPSDDGKFLVFSGGKLEFRKGQDIVVEAFRRFRETPEGKNAILVTAWQNLWPQTMQGIWESGYVKGIPSIRNGSLDISSWLEANGIPRAAHIDLGLLSQPALADAVRECDVGFFPNRCEGATNMALCETMGLGVPCIVGSWCGQEDVWMAGLGALGLHKTPPVSLSCSLYDGTNGWVEADVAECVSQLECATTYSPILDMCGDPAERFGWTLQAAVLHRRLSECVGG